MRIIFVMGVAGAGKSHYIQENFKDMKVIDLYDYQKKLGWISVDTIWESYVNCKDVLIEEIEKGNDVVLEHTLLKANRRAYYIEEIRKVTDANIECILINPSIEIIEERIKLRGISSPREIVQESLDVLEIPSLEEGFSRIEIIS